MQPLDPTLCAHAVWRASTPDVWQLTVTGRDVFSDGCYRTMTVTTEEGESGPIVERFSDGVPDQRGCIPPDVVIRKTREDGRMLSVELIG